MRFSLLGCIRFVIATTLMVNVPLIRSFLSPIGARGAYKMSRMSGVSKGKLNPNLVARVLLGTSLRMNASASGNSFNTWTFKKACDTMEVSKMPGVSFKVESGGSPSSAAVFKVGGQQSEGTESGASADGSKLFVFALYSNEVERILSGTSGSGGASGDGFFASFDGANGGALSGVLKAWATSGAGGDEGESDGDEARGNFKNSKEDAGSDLPVVTLVDQGGSISRATVVLLGREEDDNQEATFKKVAAKLASVVSKTSRSVETTSVHISVPDSFLSAPSSLKHFVNQACSTMYTDNRYRSPPPSDHISSLSSVTLYAPSDPPESCAGTIETSLALSTGVSLAKDLVNSPPNILNPLSMASTACKIASESPGGCLKAKILDVKECEARGMGAFLGVARGSETEPQFIHLTYKPQKRSSKTPLKKIAVVGKGLTFDAGGYNIKTALMELMKFDMGGSAATLGAAKAISLIQPTDVEVHFIIASCENMINERAMRPGDVLTASNGKTIEVLNTDAEGRLTLADALVYADETVKAEKIIDLATLTGACMVALGDKVAGVWTSDDELSKDLLDCADSTGDKCWRMPLEMQYDDALKGTISDLKNMGGRYGGAITAALFLKRFVKDKDKPYAHIDIAGPVWDDKGGGATGFGAKLVADWIMKENDKK